MPSLFSTLGWIAVALIVLLATIILAPFLFHHPTGASRVKRQFPANTPSLGSAILNSSGTLRLRGLLLHDSATLAYRPLVTAGEVDIAFDWTELLSLKIRQIRAENLNVYARSNGSSQLSLINLFLEQSRSAQPNRVSATVDRHR